MNAAFLLMSSAFVAGADAPVVAPAAPVLTVAPAAGCGCGPVAPACGCDSYAAAKPGFFSRLKGHCGHKNDCGCGTPLFHGFTTAASCGGCDPCAGIERHGFGSGPGLFSKLKAKFGSSGCCGDSWAGSSSCCGTPGVVGATGGGCALPPVPGAVTPAVPAAPPEKMPAPPAGKGTALLIPGLTPAAGERSPF